MEPDVAKTSKRGQRLASVDFLRGVAAVAVVIGHTSDVVPLQSYQLVLSSVLLGVPLFFVISGFCIHANWAKRQSESKDPKINFVDFWRRRLRRLYPPYFVCLCIGMLLMTVAYLHGRANIYPEPKLPWLVADFFAHVFMLHGFHPVFDWGGGNPPMWTLAREEYLYLLYFPLLFWRRSRGMAFAVAVVLLLGLGFPTLMSPFVPTATEATGSSSWGKLVHTSAIVLWIQWTLGMVSVEAHFGLIKLPRICKTLWMCIIWGSLAKLSRGVGPLYLTPVLEGLTFFTLVNYCVELEASGNWPDANRLTRFFTSVGLFSYSLYLIHNPVLRVFRQLVPPPVGANIWVCFAYQALLICCCLVIGRAFFYLVERHFLNTGSQSTGALLSMGKTG